MLLHSFYSDNQTNYMSRIRISAYCILTYIPIVVISKLHPCSKNTSVQTQHLASRGGRHFGLSDGLLLVIANVYDMKLHFVRHN